MTRIGVILIRKRVKIYDRFLSDWVSFYSIQLIHLLSLSASANQLKISSNKNWMQSLAGIWRDTDNYKFAGYMPDTSDDVWHFGAARVWSKPVRRSKYGIIAVIVFQTQFSLYLSRFHPF